jgi:hypothetical protein
MTMPNQTLTSIRKSEALHCGKKFLSLGLDGLSQQSAAPLRSTAVSGSSTVSG